MIVRYSLKRSDVWRTYWHVWRNSTKIKLIQLFIFVVFLQSALSWLGGSGLGPAARVAAAALIGCLAVALLPIYPLLRFKPEERTLRIGPTGVSTTIGRLSGDIAWRNIARIAPDTQCVYIVGKSGNSFNIPNRAFSSDTERDEFLRLAIEGGKGRRNAKHK